MSILIKGMEMPESCWDCFACHDGWCIINQKIEGHRTVTHSCPLAEVPERKHGKWLPYEFGDERWHKCSVCGTADCYGTKHISFAGEKHIFFAVRNFCPICGADMRGEP